MKKKLLILGLAGAMLLGMGNASYSEAKARVCTFTDRNHDRSEERRVGKECRL